MAIVPYGSLLQGRRRYVREEGVGGSPLVLALGTISYSVVGRMQRMGWTYGGSLGQLWLTLVAFRKVHSMEEPPGH